MGGEVTVSMGYVACLVDGNRRLEMDTESLKEGYPVSL
jgi:hypothetical protein